LIQVLEGLQERLLNRVLRVFDVMRDALGDSKEFTIVPLYKFFECANIAVLTGMNEI
jgi:hypothetical protein